MRNLFLILILILSRFTTAQSFDPTLASKLQYTLDSIRIAQNVKGISSCVIYPGLGKWKGVSGISHPGTPINSNMQFGIASNTKLFTAVLLLKLAEHHVIHLDDSLHQYLPAYNNIDSNITIRQLLNHTSGLDDVTTVPGYPDSILNNPNRIYTPGELLTWAGPPLFTAGTSWSYCNTNYLLAGMIAESATGQSYGQLLRDSILTPLQMDSTFLDVYDSVLYTVAHPWQAGVNNISVPRTALNSAAWAAGAMYSNANEMADWYQALMSGQVLNSNSINEMTTFVGSGSYGMGISEATVLGRTIWQHGGTIWGGYNSFMMYDTTSGIIICVLINQLPAQAFQVAIQLLSTILNNSVGLNEYQNNLEMVNVFPNPTHEFINISTKNKSIGKIILYNSTGETVLEEFSNNKSTKVDVSRLTKGFYYLYLPDCGTRSKLIKSED
jgi:D-alanyl-D-alanine carboxypeptidase